MSNDSQLETTERAYPMIPTLPNPHENDLTDEDIEALDLPEWVLKKHGGIEADMSETEISERRLKLVLYKLYCAIVEEKDEKRPQAKNELVERAFQKFERCFSMSVGGYGNPPYFEDVYELFYWTD